MRSLSILLIDNASTDDSVERLAAFSMKHADVVRFFPLKENLGYAAGNNVGLRYAMAQENCDYVWILNNDTLVEPDALAELVKYMEIHHEVGICGSKMVYAWDRSRLQGYGGIYHRWTARSEACVDVRKIGQIDYVIGAAALVRRSFLEEVGLMAEDYFFYFEELDWAERARGKYRLSCAPCSVVYHQEGATIGACPNASEGKSMLSDYYMVRNRLLFTRRYHPFCLPTVYLSLFLTLLNRLRRHQCARIPTLLRLMFGRSDARFEHGT